jgi:transcriptional regulator GlxA family with amidase domain
MKRVEAVPLVTVVVATPEAGASGTYAILDVLGSVGRHWQALHGEAPLDPCFIPRLLSIDGAPYREFNGTTIHPHGALAECPEPDIVIIPELIVDRFAPLPETYAPVMDWLRGAYEAGAIIATVCSGSLVLAEMGLLDGEEATTHWGYSEGMARRFPRVRIRKERILVPAGPGHRIITAGGASSWYDLLLYLIGRFAGPEEARRVARVFLLQPHSEGQLPFAGLCAMRPHEDQVVAAAQVWIAENYVNPHPVALMAERSGLTVRGFLRRFRQATGLSPMEYVQVLRIEEAKQILETTDMPLDAVAAEVGYAESASFRRLFRRMVGVSPSAYRRQHLKMLVAA